MKKLDITDWLISGEELLGYKLGTTININEFPGFEFVGPDEKYGYFYAKEGWRIGISGELVDEISIPVLANKTRLKVVVNDHGKLQTISKLYIHQFLELLNQLQVDWRPVENKDVSRLQVYVEKSDIYITFDIYEGKVQLISQSLPLNTDS